MATDSPPKPAKPTTEPKKKPDPTEELYEEDFWDKYSPHFEFPLANVASIVIHIVVFGLFLLYISNQLKFDAKTPPRIVGIDIDPSSQGTGTGKAGSGGGQEEAREDNVTPMNEQQVAPQIDLERSMVQARSWAPELAQDPRALEAVAQSPNKKKLDQLGDALKRRLLGLGDKTGAGGGEGTGTSGQTGTGAGGLGDSASSARRSARWILLFRTENGRDYLAQLGSLQAHILVPKGNKYLYWTDLTNLGNPKEILEKDIPNDRMTFIDNSADSVPKVVSALGLDFKSDVFIALIPKDVENDLAAKERAYRNRTEDQIKETTFRVLVRGGKYTVTVVDQIPMGK
jgi:hypothetical protein